MGDETRTMMLSELKTRVANAQYEVDVDAVAEAFVARMREVHRALRRADVRALVGDAALDEIQLPAAT